MKVRHKLLYGNINSISSFSAAGLDKPTKFHISTQLESTAREILSAKQSDRIQAGQFMRTKEMPINPKLDGSAHYLLLYTLPLLTMNLFLYTRMTAPLLGTPPPLSSARRRTDGWKKSRRKPPLGRPK